MPNSATCESGADVPGRDGAPVTAPATADVAAATRGLPCVVWQLIQMLFQRPVVDSGHGFGGARKTMLRGIHRCSVMM
jgi:hypothetical protein